jgi:hypothetical protein
MNLFENLLSEIDNMKAIISSLSGPTPYQGNEGFQAQAAFGTYRALVVDTLDIFKEGRVRFYNPLFHKPDANLKSLPWAYPISTFGGFDDSGATWVPPAGSTVAIICEGGNRESPFYIGTMWVRNRGVGFEVPVPEYEEVYRGRRGGYLCGPNNESQVLPPWNTENYNGFDITTTTDYDNAADLLARMTYPNIYGFKTPEKHMLKMVDGDSRCNRKWKRIELMSGCGNWLIMKDDHLHYAGQWAHPACGIKENDSSCTEGKPNPKANTSFNTDTDEIEIQPGFFGEGGDYEEALIGQENVKLNDIFNRDFKDQDISTILGEKSEKTFCVGGASDPSIIGGHPDNQLTNEQQTGSNPFFKHISECRPYRGPRTPQNNRCSLPQTGIQLLSISGHTFVMDDSVKDPRGSMDWQRGTKGFDFGCSDKFMGRAYWKSATGHVIELNDIERDDDSKRVRGPRNGIKLRSALGNSIFLSDECDESECSEDKEGKASERQGIQLISTSNHRIIMSDANNTRIHPCRRENLYGPENKAGKGARIAIRTGYGLEINMYDGDSQREAGNQELVIRAPQFENMRGDHYLKMDVKGKESNGQVILRCAGDFYHESWNTHREVVGIPNEEKSRGDKFSFVKNNKLESTENTNASIAKNHVMYAKNKTFMLSGKDYPRQLTEEELARQKAGETIDTASLEKGPNVCRVLVFDGRKGAVVLSDRLFASASKKAQIVPIQFFKPFAPEDTHDEGED